MRKSISSFLNLSFKVSSTMSAGLMVSIAGLAGVPAGALASASCPAPAVVKRATALTHVTKANYAKAETEVILADYVAKIAKGTCSAGVRTKVGSGKEAMNSPFSSKKSNRRLCSPLDQAS